MAVAEPETTETGTILVNDSSGELVDIGELDDGMLPHESGDAAARLLVFLVTESNGEETFPIYYESAGRWSGDRVAVTTSKDGREDYHDITEEVRTAFDQLSTTFS